MGRQTVYNNLNKTLVTLVALCFLALAQSVCLHAQEVAEDILPPKAVDANASEVDQMKAEREQFVKQIRRVENLNKKYTKEIEEIKELLAQKDDDFQQRMKVLEDKIASEQDAKVKEVVVAERNELTSKELESKTNEMLSKGGDLDPEDQQFKDELAKAHYNMGSIYYERGEYQRAVVEYYQAVDLAPNDADTHYNLAFISGEYLGDQETALKHYQWYLYLKPNAEDAPTVKEKMMSAKLHIRAKVDSPLDKDNGHYNIAR